MLTEFNSRGVQPFYPLLYIENRKRNPTERMVIDGRPL